MGKKGDAVKETPQQKAMAELAKNQLADYRQRWLPVQRKLAEGIKRAGAADSSERKQAEGQVSTESAVRFGEAREGLQAALTDSGAGPNSSKFKLGLTGLGDDEATSRGLGFAASDQAVDDAYMQGLGAITALGRGEKAQAMGGMQRVAAMSGQQAAADAEMSAQKRAGNAQLVGQVAGFGLSAAMQPAAPAAPGGSGGFGSVPGGHISPQGQQFNNPSAFAGGAP